MASCAAAMQWLSPNALSREFESEGQQCRTAASLTLHCEQAKWGRGHALLLTALPLPPRHPPEWEGSQNGEEESHICRVGQIRISILIGNIRYGIYAVFSKRIRCKSEFELYTTPQTQVRIPAGTVLFALWRQFFSLRLLNKHSLCFPLSFNVRFCIYQCFIGG